MADIVAGPQSYYFENSWRSGDIPDDWKRADLIPVYKNGPKEDPLSLLESLGKRQNKPPRNYYQLNEASDWENPAQIYQRQIMPG